MKIVSLKVYPYICIDTWATPMSFNTSAFATWNFILVLHNLGQNNSGIDMNRFEDMTVLDAHESIRNLKGVPLTDAFVKNQASPESIFSKIKSDLGFVRVI